MSSLDSKDRFRGCLLGLAVGDAVGTTLEFSSRRARSSRSPAWPAVDRSVLKPGEWTDDTSMALCLATSLLETNGFDPKDQMDRYCRWQQEGYLSSNGRCFDIGNTVSAALRQYRQTGDPNAGSTSPHSAGNGPIMRLAPVPMFYYPDLPAAVQYSAESSRTTHGAPECLDACRLLAGMICGALSGRSKEEILFGEAGSFHGEPKIMAIARGQYRDKAAGQIAVPATSCKAWRRRSGAFITQTPSRRRF